MTRTDLIFSSSIFQAMANAASLDPTGITAIAVVALGIVLLLSYWRKKL